MAYAPAAEAAGNALCTFGIVTDIHMADKDTVGDRNYRDADEKLADAVAAFNADGGIEFVMMIGDYIEGYGSTNSAQALVDLAQIEAVYDNLSMPRYYCLGSNHDPEELTKAQLIANCGATAMYYSFDVNNLHVVVLDAAYNSYDDDSSYEPGSINWTRGAWVSPTQIGWLKADLAATSKETIVFCHFALDRTPTDHLRGYRCFNADVVRAILVRSGKVRHVFTGHLHQQTQFTHNHICYHEIEAVTENAYPDNAYCKVIIYDNGWVDVNGLSTRITDYSAVVRLPV